MRTKIWHLYITYNYIYNIIYILIIYFITKKVFYKDDSAFDTFDFGAYQLHPFFNTKRYHINIIFYRYIIYYFHINKI